MSFSSGGGRAPREAAHHASRDSLEGFIRLEAARKGVQLPRKGAAVLARLDYRLEMELKERALRLFWKHHGLPGRPEALVASPRPRNYRTTSKRRCRSTLTAGAGPGKIATGPIFIEGDEAALLEPAEHALIFEAIGEWLLQPEFAPLARSLQFVIIRGTYAEFMVIFNVGLLDREINRLLLRLAERLRSLPPNVISAFLYLDPSHSPYYLETDRPRGSFPIKRLFGPGRFLLPLGGLTFAVPPVSFSQVNESILPPLLGKVREMMGGEHRRRLLDLYCGYGLFALSLRSLYREIIAVDAAAPSIRAAAAMLPSAPGRARIAFKVLSISRNSLAAALPPPLPPGEEDVILDPPRRGADAAVIGSIARRRPGRVLHLICASEEIPAALAAWQRCGYFARRIIPVDMFAGTPQLETLALFSRR